MSKQENYLLLALVAWVAFNAGRTRGMQIAAANAQPVYPGMSWLDGWMAG